MRPIATLLSKRWWTWSITLDAVRSSKGISRMGLARDPRLP